MRRYRIRIFIESIDEGPAQNSEAHLGTVPAEDIGPLVKIASGLGEAFTKPAPSIDQNESA